MRCKPYTKVVCSTIDGETVTFKKQDLVEKVKGNIGVGRRFVLDGVVYRVDKVFADVCTGISDGNYKHTRFEYRMRGK